ncbi:MAG: imidazole glycerol phosphate synthase subunit HisF [Bacteroidota bacterium]|jgi:cyclase
MLKIRIIPVLTFNGLALVKTKNFSNPRMVGNPVQAARVFNSRNVDELVFTDIMASAQNRNINLPFVREVINECFMPVTIGGGIRTLDDINGLLKIGADKVLLKSVVLSNPGFIGEAAAVYGSQCISVSLDASWNKERNAYMVYNRQGMEEEAVAFASRMEEAGAGEIILSSVDRDGTMGGFDIRLVEQILSVVNIPVVAVGGASAPEDFLRLFRETTVKAAGASSMFYFTQFTSYDVKKLLNDEGYPARVIPIESAESIN